MKNDIERSDKMERLAAYYKRQLQYWKRKSIENGIRTAELEAKLETAVDALGEVNNFLDIEAYDILRGEGCYRIAKAMRELGIDIPDEWVSALDKIKEITGDKP